MSKWHIHQDNSSFDEERHSFTLTLNKNYEGWNTDSGYCGYGLPKELAQWICDALNNNIVPCPYEMNKYGTWQKIGSEEDE